MVIGYRGEDTSPRHADVSFFSILSLKSIHSRYQDQNGNFEALKTEVGAKEDGNVNFWITSPFARI